MAIAHDMMINTHNSIYPNLTADHQYGRRLKIYFSEPSQGINADTGICVLIAGFGGSAFSSVYKKMRDQFADQYNLVTVQCDYFGWEFMQDASPDTWEKAKDSKDFVEQTLNENWGNFADMGILQAIDHIVAVLSVMNILYENDCEFNAKKIILYGHSQGAYLAHLCNTFAPGLFSLLIDNSAWLYPVYVHDKRVRFNSVGGGVEFSYLATLLEDKEIFSLPTLYSQFINQCNIVVYQGESDSLVKGTGDKFAFCRGISNCVSYLITRDKVDGVMFKSTGHALDANFLALFEHVMSRNKYIFGRCIFSKSNSFQLPEQAVFRTGKYEYHISYENVFPALSIKAL